MRVSHSPLWGDRAAKATGLWALLFAPLLLWEALFYRPRCAIKAPRRCLWCCRPVPPGAAPAALATPPCASLQPAQCASSRPLMLTSVGVCRRINITTRKTRPADWPKLQGQQRFFDALFCYLGPPSHFL